MRRLTKNDDFKTAMFSGLMLLVISSQSVAEPLKVGASFAPPYYTVEGKQVTGIFGELMSNVLAKAGVDFVWEPLPTKRIYQDLITGALDIYLGPLQPSLEGFNDGVLQGHFSPVSIELRCFYFGEKPAITKKEDLVGKQILIIRGYTYGGLVNFILDPQNHVDYHEVTSFEQAITMLKLNRGDYHLDYRKTGEISLAAHPEPDVKYSTLSVVDLYVMVSKHTPNAEALLTRVETAFREIAEQK